MSNAFLSVDAYYVMWFQFPIQTKELTVAKFCIWPKQHFAIGADIYRSGAIGAWANQDDSLILANVDIVP